MEIARMTKGSWGMIKAFFDVKIKIKEYEEMPIKGFKLIQGDNGMFVGVPSITKEEKYQNIVEIKLSTMEDLKKIANKHYEEN